MTIRPTYALKAQYPIEAAQFSMSRGILEMPALILYLAAFVRRRPLYWYDSSDEAQTLPVTTLKLN